MRKIRIAFFTDILTKNTDGVTRTLFNIIKRIPRDEFEILFITSKPHTRIEDIGWPILYCPALNFPLYPQYQVAFPFFNKRLNQKLNEFNPDIVHFTSPSLLGLFATRYGIHHKKPIVNLYHTHFTAYLKYYFPRIFLTPINGLTNKIIRRIYQPCTITYAPSSPIHKFLIQQGLPKESLRILGRGVNLERFSPRFRDSTTTIKALVSPKLKLLFVGRLVFEKEIKTLVRIYQKLNQINLDVQFIIVGDGPRKPI